MHAYHIRRYVLFWLPLETRGKVLNKNAIRPNLQVVLPQMVFACQKYATIFENLVNISRKIGKYININACVLFRNSAMKKETLLHEFVITHELRVT